MSEKIRLIRKKNFRRNVYRFLPVFLLLAGGIFFVWLGSFRIPDFNSFEERKVQSSTKIYDRTGKILLYDVHENIRRTLISGSDMGINIKNATVAIEDSEFYEHKGIKPTAIIRAVLVNLFSPITGQNTQGGSTITQQVIKNVLLTKEKSITRKIKEWILAVKLEQTMSKDEILSLYLNESPYGGNIYGILEASRTYLGKEPRDLSLAESAYLAALPQAPTFYSPYGNNRNRLDERKNVVLKRMFDLGFIEEKEYQEAKNEVVVFLPNSQNLNKAMHFVLYVREYLEEHYGQDALESGGLKVITTLDYELQGKAEEIVKRYSLQNEKDFNAKNAGLVATDPKTGQILVMVGSRDYFDKNIEGNFNIALAHRQPGSAFKPFVYATAFSKGYTPDTVIFDLPTEFQTTCTPEGKPLPGTSADDCYMPENYDQKYRGPISLREALAQSINVPAIKVLYLAGLRDSLALARDAGIRSLNEPDRYGLTLVLGGGEVSLLELTGAYGVFANNGVRHPLTPILKVEDGNGSVLEEYRERGAEAIPKDVALQITDVLSDEVARAPAFGNHSPLYFPGRQVAAKTGTTNDYRDAWILGYTPSLSVGAWVGNNDNTPMEKKVARFIVAPLWNEFMREALKTVPVEFFEKPKPIDPSIKPALRGFWQGNKTFVVDKISGNLATEFTPKETREERVIVNVHSILYWVSKNDPLGQPPSNPENDSQFKHWEVPIQKWLQGRSVPGYKESDIPTATDSIHSGQNTLRITILEPLAKTSFKVGSRVLIKTQSVGQYQIKKMDYFLNSIYLGSVSGGGQFSFVINDADVSLGENTLRVVGYDSVFNSGESSVPIFISE